MSLPSLAGIGAAVYRHTAVVQFSAAPISVRDGIPRFTDDDYAESFGWQWHRWDAASDLNMLLRRTHFDQYDLAGKTILECGAGSGGDTEALIKVPFGEVHAFDLSQSVDRIRTRLNDPRLVISQASIFDIPYPDQSFDVVFCHRVLQHTPRPLRALRLVARKVKPGGILFAHCYKLSLLHAAQYKYKYRWLTKRLDRDRLAGWLDRHGDRLHRVNVRWRTGNVIARGLAWNFMPFEWHGDDVKLEKLVTFDALTPWYDRPVTARAFRRTIEGEGFTIEHMHDPPVSPLYCTAVRA